MTDEFAPTEIQTKFHGTHSIPKEFWSGEPGWDTRNAAAKQRRKTKRSNHERNAMLHRAWNQYEGASGPKPDIPRPIGGKRYFDKHGNRRVGSTRRTG